jgi:hypothetical protein
MENFTVQMGEEDYRIVGPEEEEGPMVPYGQTATLMIEEAVYYCHVEEPDESTPVVFRVDRVSKMPTETDEVEFPPEVVAAQRKLDEAVEKQADVIDATVDDLTGKD